MAIVVTLTDIEMSEISFGEHTRLKPEKSGSESSVISGANSGCMRGNDRYRCNGSAPVGYYATKEEPTFEQKSYSDFIRFNYGSEQDRQHESSPKWIARKKRYDR